MNFIRIYECEDGEPVEIPLEEDDTVLFTTLSGQFPKVSGLKYHGSGSTNFRAVKLSDGKLYQPAEGWAELKLICVFPKEIDNKRKCREDYEISTAKTKRMEGRKCTDLIVLNLGWKVDEEMLKSYFSTFGELVLVQVKKDRETTQSKGYAFIRFGDYESQVLCLAEKHLIDGRWCAVKVPFSKSEADKQEISKKIHVSFNSESVTMDDLRLAFEEYGYVADIFIPKPFRNFAFVTFDSSDVAQSLIGRTVTVKECTITIGSAVPKITGNKKAISAQYPIYSYNEQTTFPPPARYGWAGFEHAPAAASYKCRQEHRHSNTNTNYGNNTNSNNNNSSHSNHTNHNNQNHHNHYPGLIPNSSFMMPNGRTHSMISIDYGQHQQQAGQDNMGQNTAAMAALNILNNPDVVAAIVAAASKSGQSSNNIYPHQQ